MGCWLKYSDHYFDGLDLSTQAAKQQLSTLISAACEFVEKTCDRAFASASHDDVFEVERDGTILLSDPPVTEISRICSAYSFFTIQNTTAQVASFHITDTAIKLNSITAGVAATSSITLASYATITLLAAAIEAVSGWSVTITSGYESFPTSDLVVQQYGEAVSSRSVYGWKNYSGSIHWNKEIGVLEGLPAGDKVRVVYVAGFSDVPEPIKQVAANLATGVYEGEKIKSESLGQYSYTTEDLNALPGSDKQILALYRDRRA